MVGLHVGGFGRNWDDASGPERKFFNMISGAAGISFFLAERRSRPSRQNADAWKLEKAFIVARGTFFPTAMVGREPGE